MVRQLLLLLLLEEDESWHVSGRVLAGVVSDRYMYIYAIYMLAI